MTRDRKGEKGKSEGKSSPVSDGCPKAGLGVVGGKGLASPLPPAARRAGDHTQMRGKSRQPAEKKEDPFSSVGQQP